MKSKYLNKQETAEAFEVSLPTLNGWVRGGCPVAQRGGITKPWKFDIVALATW
jgi:phage terminase Nu1 subunit (DNA packaging protein)